LIDKLQFATVPENNTTSGEIVPVPGTSASVHKDRNNKEDITDPRSIPILNQELLDALRTFFELLDEWDHKEEQP